MTGAGDRKSWHFGLVWKFLQLCRVHFFLSLVIWIISLSARLLTFSTGNFQLKNQFNENHINDSQSIEIDFIWFRDLFESAQLCQKKVFIDAMRLFSFALLFRAGFLGHRLTWRAYHRLNDIYSYLDYLVATYPDLCSVQTIGYSHEKRPLRVLR